jgi:hypothetical protein
MSNTIAHRPHVHHNVSLMPVLAVIVAIAIAAVVIWAVNQPQTTSTTTTGSAAVSVPVVQPGAPPVPESPVFRHAQIRALQNGGYSQPYLYGRLHQVDGTTNDPLTTTP